MMAGSPELFILISVLFDVLMFIVEWHILDGCMSLGIIMIVVKKLNLIHYKYATYVVSWLFTKSTARKFN